VVFGKVHRVISLSVFEKVHRASTSSSFNQDMFVCFVDNEKAFDRVDRKKLM